MKRKNITFLLILCFSSTIFQFSSVSSVDTNIEAYWNRGQIFASNLDFGLTLPSGVDTNNILVETDVIGLDPNRQIQMFEPTIAGDYKIYSSRMWFKAQANIYSTFGARDVMSSAEYEIVEEEWLHVIETTNWGLTSAASKVHTYLDASWKSYTDLSVKSGAKLDGYVTLSCEFDDMLPTGLDFGNTQVTFVTKSITGNVLKTSIIDWKQGSAGDYNDIYSGSQGAQLTSTDLSPTKESATGYGGEASSDLSQKITDLALGVKSKSKTYETLQQGKVNVLSGQVSNNQFHVKCIPNIVETHEPVDVKSCTIAVDTKTGAFGVSPAEILTEHSTSPITNTHDRVIGWSVDNKWIQINFVVEVEVYSTVKMTYNVAGDYPELDIPSAQIDDFYWDTLITGETEMDILVDTEDPVISRLDAIWENYKGIIILGATALIIVGGVYMYFFSPIGRAIRLDIENQMLRRRKK